MNPPPHEMENLPLIYAKCQWHFFMSILGCVTTQPCMYGKTPHTPPAPISIPSAGFYWGFNPL